MVAVQEISSVLIPTIRIPAIPNTGFCLETMNPVPNSAKFNMNATPESMWQNLEQEQNQGIGWHEPIDASSGVWGAFPINQYAPEWGDNAHYMTTFRLGDRFAMPYNIPQEAQVAAGKHLQTHLDNPNSFLSYNITYGPNSWKQSSMTWENWHIHCCKIQPEALKGKSPRNTKILEPGQELRDDFFLEQVTRLKADQPEALGILADAEFVDLHDKAAYGYLPTGLVFSMPANISSDQFFQVFTDIDNISKGIHRDVFSSCVTNYDDVEDTNWYGNYTMRSQEDLKAQLAGRSPLEQEFLCRTHAAITFGTQDGLDEKKRIFKSPCYSVAAWQANDRIVFLADPHSFRKKGGLEAMGIEMSRKTSPEASIDIRRKNALNMFTQTQAKSGIC